jgi:hypothetical protein
MGTRSRIGVMHGSKCKSVYCHWDGYLEHNGAILLEHFDSSKANELVGLGDLSSLRPEIGVKHPFSCLDAEAGSDYEERYGNMCTFYDRDRGETDCTWSVDHSFEDFLDRARGCGAEFYYIMRDGEWYVGTTYESDMNMGGKLVLLAEVLATEEVAQ